MENLPTLLCIGLITLLFVVPMWAYINVTERKARIERDKAIEAGRHEPVTIQPFVDLSVCMGSGACVPACPEDVLKVIDGQAVAVNMSACIGHGACVPACPVGAIELVFGSEKRGIDIPRVGPDFQTNVPGVYIAGELGGMGLIASAAEQGVKALDNAIKGVSARAGLTDVIIVGAGPAGLAAAAAAKQKGVSYVLVDQEQVGGAVRHYPRKKLVFTRPMDIPGYGKVNLKTLRKEELVDLFENIVTRLSLQVDGFEPVSRVRGLPEGGFEVVTAKRSLRGQRVILALGRRGTPRKLDVPGEDQEKVAYSLLEPEHYQYDHLLIVGGGDSAVEAALQLSEQPGNTVTLSYRGDKINRPKEKNIQLLREAVKANRIDLMLESQVKEIGADRVTLDKQGESLVVPNDHVFVMVGGVLPTKFLQDVGIKIQKHFGKRIEGDVDEVRIGSQTGAIPLPSLTPGKLGGNDDKTMALGLKGNDEPTVSLAGAGLEELMASLARPATKDSGPATVALSLPGQAPAGALAPGGPPAPGRPARPPTGLQLLDTRTMPKGGVEEPVDELPNRVGPPAGPRKKEVTEIKPLKRVSLGSGSPTPAPSRPTGPSEEGTVPRAPSGAAGSSGSGAPPAEPGEGLGRVVARRPDSLPPRTPDVPSPASASPISMRLSRVAGARNPAIRSPIGSPASNREEPRQAGDNPASDTRVQTARRLLAEGAHDDVLRLARELASAGAEGRRQALLLEGEVHLARGQWSAAIEPLRAAVEAARSDGGEALGRACSALGRAYHHAGRFDECRAALVEATRAWTPPPLESAAILRLLGDLALRVGDLETAEQRWSEALELGRTAGSADAQARAWRGLASCTALRGHYPESLDQLDEALALVRADADPIVVTAVLARKLELEAVLGRYARALESGELMLELTARADLPASRAEALGLLAEVLAALGLNDEVLQAAGEVAGLVTTLGARGVDPGIRTARALCEIGRPAEALGILDHLPEPGPSPVDDPRSQLDAVRARALARTDPVAARELATDVLGRSAPSLAIRSARIRLDAALALHETGADAAARSAVKRGLKAVQGSGNKGLKLELLIAMYITSPDHRVVEAAARAATRVMEDLPPNVAASFRQRKIIAEALSRFQEPG